MLPSLFTPPVMMDGSGDGLSPNPPSCSAHHPAAADPDLEKAA
jgi:hypothetical protein